MSSREEAASTAPIRREDSVRQVMVLYPHLVAVFERHGLMGCGGNAGPDERLDLFAAIHRIDVESLLTELNAARAAPTAHEPASEDEENDSASSLHRRFIWTAIACTLTMGATFGAYNLLVIHEALGPLPAAHNWVHAGFQIFGFVLLFTMGVAYHAVPRFLGVPLQRQGLARASLPLVVAGLVLRSYGQAGPIAPGAMPALALGAAGLGVGMLLFAIVLGSTWRKSESPTEPYLVFLGAGTVWWLATGGLLAAEALAAIHAHDVDAASNWHEALYAAALFGGTLSWIEGMLLRTGPVFLHLRATRRVPLVGAFLAGQLGALLAAAGDVLGGDRVADAGLLALSAGVVLFIVALRPFASAGAPAEADPGFTRVVRLSLGWALAFAGLASSYAVLDLTAGPASNLIFDGARHAFALGFVTPIIFGMASRILPIFNGVPLAWPRLRIWGAWLIVFGVALRELEVVAVFGFPALLHLSGVSGLIAATGVALMAAPILGTLRAAGRVAPGRAAGKARELPDLKVSALIAAHPEAMPILIEAGFAQLASPIARRTLARMVTLRQACAMHGIDLDAVVERIRKAGPLSAGPAAFPVPATELRETPIAAAPPLVTLGRELSEAAVRAILRSAVDPELGMNVVELGLIYGVELATAGRVHIRMTLTTPHCPYGEELVREVHDLVAAHPGVSEVTVELVLDPPWDPTRMAPDARAALGLS